MKIQILSVSHKPPLWADRAFEDYAKRLPKNYQLSHHAFPPKTPALEAKALLTQIPEKSYFILLDVRGKSFSSLELSQQFERWEQGGKDLVFVIGGPDGVTPEIQARAHETWSLSPLTFPHALARVMLIEQLYRAWTLKVRHPYHRE